MKANHFKVCNKAEIKLRFCINNTFGKLSGISVSSSLKGNLTGKLICNNLEYSATIITEIYKRL